MKKLSAFVLLMLSLAGSTTAQIIDPATVDFGPLRSNLDALAPYLAKDKLTNGDVTVVAAIACDTLRLSRVEHLVERIWPIVQKTYPRADSVRSISPGDFVQYEQAVFSSLKVSPQAIDMITMYIKNNASFPVEAPGNLPEFRNRLDRLENDGCENRAIGKEDQSAPTSEQKSGLAWALGKATVGVTAIVADVIATPAVTSATGPVGAGVLNVISGGWGWNRCEEAYFDVLALFKR